MDSDEIAAAQRDHEWYHGLRLLPGAWAVVRVDGRSFTRVTADHFEKPFDEAFARHMLDASAALMHDFGGVFAHTASDEISVVLPPAWELFDRSVEKVVSLSAGMASAVFTNASGVPAHFDSRVWLGARVEDVVDYFSWRQADASRCALNGWAYWTLRRAGASVAEATRRLEGASVAGKNDLLFQAGINFNEVPLWQRRGAALWWEQMVREGFNPQTRERVEVTRRSLHIDEELPMREGFRALVAEQLAAAVPAEGT